jgi:hypothetical protein
LNIYFAGWLKVLLNINREQFALYLRRDGPDKVLKFFWSHGIAEPLLFYSKRKWLPVATSEGKGNT